MLSRPLMRKLARLEEAEIRKKSDMFKESFFLMPTMPWRNVME